MRKGLGNSRSSSKITGLSSNSSSLIGFLTLNILIVPLRNSYKLGAINNYIPPILDLIEPALLLILALWITGTIIMFFNKHARIVTVVITSVMIVLFFFVD